jgi:hypothetical protein
MGPVTIDKDNDISLSSVHPGLHSGPFAQVASVRDYYRPASTRDFGRFILGAIIYDDNLMMIPIKVSFNLRNETSDRVRLILYRNDYASKPDLGTLTGANFHLMPCSLA